MRKLDHQNIVKLRFFFYSSGDKVGAVVVCVVHCLECRQGWCCGSWCCVFCYIVILFDVMSQRYIVYTSDNKSC